MSVVGLAHLLWRDKLMTGRAPDLQVDPSTCTLGKWLATRAPASGRRAVLAELVPAHPALHQTAVGIRSASPGPNGVCAARISRSRMNLAR